MMAMIQAKATAIAVGSKSMAVTAALGAGAPAATVIHKAIGSQIAAAAAPSSARPGVAGTTAANIMMNDAGCDQPE